MTTDIRETSPEKIIPEHIKIYHHFRPTRPETAEDRMRQRLREKLAAKKK
jgi:hypothetical protein